MLSRWLRRWFGKKTNPTVTRSRKGQRRPTTRLFLEMLEDRIAPAVVSDPVLQLSDINQTTQASTPSNFVGSVNGKTFFEANDGINGIQLWMTNGTPGNATMLTNPGNTLNTGTVPIIVGNEVYFLTGSGQNEQLWESDGTTTQAVSTTGFSLGNLGYYDATLMRLNTGTGQLLVFAAFDSNSSYVNDHIFATDGTSVFNVLASNSLNGDDYNLGASWAGFTTAGAVHELVFSANDPTTDLAQLWTTDGTTATEVTNVAGGLGISQVTASGNAVFFAGNYQSYNITALWSYDGTNLSVNAGIHPTFLTDVSGGGSSPSVSFVSSQSFLRFNTAQGGTASSITLDATAPSVDGIFVGDTITQTSGAGNGQSAVITAYNGTTKVATISGTWTPPDNTTSFQIIQGDNQLYNVTGTNTASATPVTTNFSGIGDLTAPANGTLFFTGSHAGQSGVWKSTGGGTATSVLTGGSVSVTGGSVVAVGASDVVFNASVNSGFPNTGENIFFTDGTTVTEITNFTNTSFVNLQMYPPDGNAVIGNQVYFEGFDFATSKYQLWVADISAGGSLTQLTNQVKPESSTGIEPSRIAASGGLIFFSGDDGIAGREPWVSNGTPGGTSLLFDVNKITNSSTPSSYTVLGSQVFFTADDGLHGKQLWVANTSGGFPTMLTSANFSHSTNGTSPTDLTIANGKLFFLGTDASGTTRLYESDGTVGGTVVVPGTSSLFFQNLLISTGSQVVFFASGGGAIQVFSTDGTTVHSFTANPSVASLSVYSPDGGIGTGGSAYFLAYDGSAYQVWKADTSTFVATQVTTLANLSSDDAKLWTVANGLVFFQGTWGGANNALFVTDGTNVSNLLPNSTPVNLIDASSGGNTRLFFWATDVVGGSGQTVLWVSDGTVGGTKQLTQGNSGPLTQADNLQAQTVVNGKLFFLAFGPGEHLFESDGTTLNTVAVSTTSGISGWDVQLIPDAAHNQVICSATVPPSTIPGETDSTDELFTVNATTGALTSLSGSSNSVDLLGGSGTWVNANGQFFIEIQDFNKGSKYFLAETDGTQHSFFEVPFPGGGAPGAPGGNAWLTATANGMVFLTGTDPLHGTEFWQTDINATGIGWGTPIDNNLALQPVVLAAFNDIGESPPGSDGTARFSASINWGDGTSSAA